MPGYAKSANLNRPLFVWELISVMYHEEPVVILAHEAEQVVCLFFGPIVIFRIVRSRYLRIQGGRGTDPGGTGCSLLENKHSVCSGRCISQTDTLRTFDD